MSLLWVLFGLRLLATIILYIFLTIAFQLIWRELKQTTAQISSSTSAHLHVIAADNPAFPIGQIFPLQQITWLGQAPENTIIVDDERTLHRHACLFFDGNSWCLENLSSPEETQVNRSPVSHRVAVQNGDLIEIGRVCFRLDVGQGSKVIRG